MIEWIDTASVMVSIKPEVSEVTRIRKLEDGRSALHSVSYARDSLPNPGRAGLLLPDLAEDFDELNGELLLSQVGAGLDDDRDDVPAREVAVRRRGADAGLFGRERLAEDGACTVIKVSWIIPRKMSKDAHQKGRPC